MTARGTVAAEWLFATLGAASQVVCGKEFVQETVIENFPQMLFCNRSGLRKPFIYFTTTVGAHRRGR
jgi:hypothetical protein